MGLGILPLAMGSVVPAAAHAGMHHGAVPGQPPSASPCADTALHGAATTATCDHHPANCHCPQACQATGVPATPPRRIITTADREAAAARPAPATIGFPSAPWRPPSSLS